MLLLNGVDITCATGAPIPVLNADKTIITLASGTENTVTDGDGFVSEEWLRRAQCRDLQP